MGTWKSATNQNANQANGYDATADVVNDGVNQYLYDAEGRICAVASSPLGVNGGLTMMTGYLYDAEGTRVSKGTITTWSCDPTVSGFTTTSDYILGLSGEQLTETGLGTVNGVAAMVPQHINVWADGKLMATYDQDGGGVGNNLHYYFDDPLGTRRAQTDGSGVLEQTCFSLPYGDGETCGPTPTEHLFTGKERDTESGNDYFGARYYASSMGRFMSPDNGIDQDHNNPQSWNLYSYVRNNPLSRVDPNGRLTIIAGGTGWSTANWNDNMKLANEARQNFHDANVIVLNKDQWSGAYTQDAMDHGAQSIRDIVANYSFAPGEQLNLIGHSRGADLEVEATNGITHKVDNLITLAMPNDPLVNADASNIGLWINVETAQDLVKALASGWYAPNPSAAHNLTLGAAGYGPVGAHTAIWNDDSLRQQWWQFWNQQANDDSSVTTVQGPGTTK